MKNIDEVVKDRLCHQCGTCVGVCPKENIEMVKAKNEVFVPKRIDPEKCGHCQLCRSVCPGQSVDFDLLNSFYFNGQKTDKNIGPYTSLYLGHSRDQAVRLNSASGGLVTSLLIYAMREKVIDGALVVRMNKSDPLMPEVVLAQSEEEIRSAAQSKYIPVPLNVGIRQLLKKEGRFAVTGLPCHIHGLRKAEMVLPALRKKVLLHLGLLCGPSPSFRCTRYLLKILGTDLRNIQEIKYREGDWSGSIHVAKKDGNRQYQPFLELNYALFLFNRSRCSICPDHTNELADISFGDAWLKEVLDDAESKLGSSIVIVRSKLGKDLIEKASSKGFVDLKSLAYGKLLVSTGAMLVFKKKNIFARTGVLKALRRKIPCYEGLKRPKKTGVMGYMGAILYLAMTTFADSMVGLALLSAMPKRVSRKATVLITKMASAGDI